MAVLAPSPEHSDRAIMQRAVLRLRARLPELADQLVTEILSGEGHGRPAELSLDLREMCHEGLSRGLDAVLGMGGPRADLRWAEEIGRRRAEQGLPLDRLLRSYRLAGSVYWENIVATVSENEPDHVPVLLRHATRTWHTIDQQSTTAAEAYHRAEYQLLRRSEERVSALLDALLDGRGSDGGLASTAASMLELPLHGRYAVVVLRLSRRDALDQRLPGGSSDGMRILWRMRADMQVGVVGLGSATLDDLVGALRPGLHGHLGVSTVVDALADLGRARWLAELALRTCTAPGPEIARLDQRLPGALMVSQPELARHLSQEVLGGLVAMDAALSDLLFATLTTWIECDGSAVRAAERLYCHRNTVLNRLRRLEKATGRSLTRPLDLAELVLASNAFRIYGRDPTPDGVTDLL
ncbi:PucR family transcriptional regulator [Actinomadura scrupuli]|uniref:PucR family transcriptional regulator n=1 Tax=Actinomadura scrupuli TaxID=559629 RepID=UPI003D96928E